MAKMTIKMPDPTGFSDVQLEEKMLSLQQAAAELKAYRVRLAEESDIRQGKRPPNKMGSNPVIIKMKPAIMRSRAQS